MTSDSKNFLPVLHQIKINTPCPINWDEMDGNASRRFCGYCQKNVHNFEEMDAKSVGELLNSDTSICAKIRRRSDGSIVTKATPTLRCSWFARLGGLAASIAAMLALGGCRETTDDVTGLVAPPTTVEAPVLVGEVDRSELGDVVMVQPETIVENLEESFKTIEKAVKPTSE